jgi:hypothetical protein
MGIVHKLVDAVIINDGKLILECVPSLPPPRILTSKFSEPAARAVWETVMRAHESPSVSSDPEPMLLDIPMENPPNPPAKPRPRPTP